MEEKDLRKNREWEAFGNIQVIEEKGEKKVLAKGQEYMSWRVEDQSSQRMAIVELYKSRLATQEDLAKAFGVHVNTIYNYVTTFEEEGMKGLIGEHSGPKGSWKITPEVRGKILLTVLKDKVKEYSAIQKELEKGWKIKVSIESIRQVLIENGFVEERIREDGVIRQNDLFDERGGMQLEIGEFNNGYTEESLLLKDKGTGKKDDLNIPVDDRGKKGLRHYSSVERTYIDRMEQ